MPEPVFKLKIVWPDGSDVMFNAGNPQSNPYCLEANIIEACKKALQAKGVGIFKSETKVLAALEASIIEVFTNLKKQTIQIAHTQLPKE